MVKVTRKITVVLEQCPNPKCRHEFKPRKTKRKPVCPRCHTAI